MDIEQAVHGPGDLTEKLLTTFESSDLMWLNGGEKPGAPSPRESDAQGTKGDEKSEKPTAKVDGASSMHPIDQAMEHFEGGVGFF